jgi:hypothetical protein
MDIIVWVPAKERKHFWEGLPNAVEEWWTLSRKPKDFKVGDHIWFQIDDHLVAKAKTCDLREQDQECDATGRTWSGYHLVWKCEDFQKLKNPILWKSRITRGYTYKTAGSDDAEASRILDADIARGLEELHAKRVVHRVIKVDRGEPSCFHKRPIETRGVVGEISKIREELEEVEEALEQGDSMLVLVEVVDLLGAVHAFLVKRYGPTLGLPEMLNFSMNMVDFHKKLHGDKK